MDCIHDDSMILDQPDAPASEWIAPARIHSANQALAAPSPCFAQVCPSELSLSKTWSGARFGKLLVCQDWADLFRNAT